jgi:hypothetical protein
VGIRETLNKNPAVASGVVIGLIVLVLTLIIWWSSSGGPTTADAEDQKAFFTNDDGKTWFTDSAAKIPPFQKDGKDAVLAHVYSCDGKPFVAFMRRFTPDAKKKLEAANSNKSKPQMAVADVVQFNGIEVKAPGGKEWYKQSDERAVKVMQPQCNGKLELVYP